MVISEVSLRLVKQSQRYVMPNIILSDTSASVSELKKNPMATVSSGDGYPVAILNRNQPAMPVGFLYS